MPPFKSLRTRIPWFPSIDYDVCLTDLKCLNFCPHEVFEWDAATGRPVVAHPLRCLPGCTICLEGCDAGALSLPTKSEFQATREKLREKDSKRSTPTPLP
jgi:NAD-dependent dihydropyrimidine dehydrogenase PreA subunit